MSFVIRQAGKKKFKPSLAGYKAQHQALALEKGLESQFMAAKTITEAKKILWGKGKKR